MINQQRLLQTFLDLVRIDSPSSFEAEIGRELDARLQTLGLQTEMDAVGNLVGRTSTGAGDWLLLSTHMDTVGTDRGITPVIRDGVVYSDGTTILGADDKSGVAAVLEVLTVLREQGLPHPPLEVVISVGEELGLYGARNLDTSRLRARYGIVLDSGGPIGHIVVSAPSQDNIRLTVHGVSAHAGAEPEKGINAIRVAAEAIAAMPLGRIDAETTCNVGIIEGGTARNIVPERVKIIGEARSRDNAKLEALTARIVAAFQDSADRHGARLEADVTRTYNTYRLAENEPIVQAVAGAARSLGHSVQLRASGGGTDGNIYTAAGIPCVVISTGMAEVHTPNEHIAIEDFVASADLLLAAVQRLAE
ncbi:MAG: M20/M25/M40 family metallo-hydrolase [Anaerolineae bacterium]